jgi:hypothetical protein
MFYVRSFTNDPSLVPVGQINWAASGASRDICYGNFIGEHFWKSTNQNRRTPLVATYFIKPERNVDQLQGTFPSTSLPSLVNILQAVSEKMEMWKINRRAVFCMCVRFGYYNYFVLFVAKTNTHTENRPSVNFSHFHLLWNRLTDINQTWQGCWGEGPLQSIYISL